MPYAIEFGGSPQDATLTTSGRLSGEEVLGFVLELVAHPSFRRGLFVLADHSALDPAALTADDMKALAELVASLDEQLGEAHIAIVAPDATTFGFARVWELHAAETRLHSRVFESRADAVAWLRAQRAAHGGDPG